jgi:putative ABC transport system substrate-binding protein
MTDELNAKRLALLKETVPQAQRVGILWNPNVPWHAKAIQELKAVAPGLSIKLKIMTARGPEDFSSVFSAARRAHVQAVDVLESANYWNHRAELLSIISKARIPAIYGQKAFADAGGLIAYGTNFSDIFRRSAGYVDKILKGAKPGDIPIEQPTKFDLVVNLKTAKTLGITIPESILLRADQVIR